MRCVFQLLPFAQKFDGVIRHSKVCKCLLIHSNPCNFERETHTRTIVVVRNDNSQFSSLCSEASRSRSSERRLRETRVGHAVDQYKERLLRLALKPTRGVLTKASTVFLVRLPAVAQENALERMLKPWTGSIDASNAEMAAWGSRLACSKVVTGTELACGSGHLATTSQDVRSAVISTPMTTFMR